MTFTKICKSKIKPEHYKIWPKEKGLFSTDNVMWKNKIAYIDITGYPSGIIIENEAMAQSFSLWFNEMWNGL